MQTFNRNIQRQYIVKIYRDLEVPIYINCNRFFWAKNKIDLSVGIRVWSFLVEAVFTSGPVVIWYKILLSIHVDKCTYF
jgi:hypothetical protein